MCEYAHTSTVSNFLIMYRHHYFKLPITGGVSKCPLNKKKFLVQVVRTPQSTSWLATPVYGFGVMQTGRSPTPGNASPDHPHAFPQTNVCHSIVYLYNFHDSLMFLNMVSNFPVLSKRCRVYGPYYIHCSSFTQFDIYIFWHASTIV